MIGIDTNVLVRLLVNDDKNQAAYAAKLIENNFVFIPKSVLLETEWVLRYTYELSSPIILDAFEKLLGHKHITIEEPTHIAQALQWYANGFDFADALHLASSQKAKQFATFDKNFIKKARKNHIDAMMPGKL
jgi:predicted nucleic-acid-binding protein